MTGTFKFAVALASLLVASQSVVAASPVSAIGKFQRVADPVVQNHKSTPFLFMSALFCPYCAAERWAIVDALQRFGTWSNLHEATSTSGIDGFAALPTYDFVHAHYSSPYVAFTVRDVADGQGRPLESLSPGEKATVNTYDPKGGIPFLYVDDAFVQLDAGYSPGLLANKTFSGVQEALRNHTELGQAIDSEANVLTALICVGDGDRPANVCSTPVVAQLARRAR